MVRKHINIDTEVILKDFQKYLQIKLQINQLIGVELSMGLLLLREKLIDILEIEFKNFAIVINLTSSRRSYAKILTKTSLTAKISTDNLDYILHYILKFYRDCIAEAEHIDVDFVNPTGSECTLTICCNEYQEYCEDEIRKMLNIEK